MVKKKTKIAFLLDVKNSWIDKYIRKKYFIKKNKNFKLFNKFKKIINFDIVFILGYTKILPKSIIKSLIAPEAVEVCTILR